MFGSFDSLILIIILRDIHTYKMNGLDCEMGQWKVLFCIT